MHLWQAIKMACKSLWTNKMRSFLTMLGIIIGVFTVSLLTTVAQGVSDAVVSSIRTQSTLAVMMNMSPKMKFNEANTIIKTVQPTDRNAEDYFEYSLVLSSNSVATSQNIEGVTEDFESYLKYEKLYRYTAEELEAMTSQERVIANALMAKKKQSPSKTQILAVQSNFTDVYELKFDGSFPKTNDEILVDREFVEYYFENKDYTNAINKDISLGVTYYTEINIVFAETPNESVLENICKFLAKEIENPTAGEGGEEENFGIGLKIIENEDGSRYTYIEDTKTMTVKTDFFSYLPNEDTNENPQDDLKSVILTYGGAFGATISGVQVEDKYSGENVKSYKIVGVLTDENDSMFSGMQMKGSSENEDELNMQTLMSQMFNSTRGTAYILAADENLASANIDSTTVSNSTITYAYFRFKTEDVMEDMTSNITIAFIQAGYGMMTDFMLVSMSSVANIISQVMDILTIMLTVISVISLIVGGIGIMNIMLVAVSERTREIGIRKAIGAKKSSILAQFLVEALLLSLLGGAIGLILSAIGSAIIGSVMGVAMLIPAWVVAMSLGFCTAIGLIFGMFPAVKASNMQPIDALRRE